MATISITKGITLPFKKKCNEKKIQEIYTKKICIDLSSFTYLHLKINKNIDDNIIKGEVLLKDNHLNERVYISPVSGKIINILYGKRRRITGIIIDVSDLEEKTHKRIDYKSINSKEELLNSIFSSGLSFYIHKRPFNRLIKKDNLPRSIFINTVNSSPYTPSFSYILKDHEELFQIGIELLNKFSVVHLVYNESIFKNFKNCIPHKIIGPHPINSSSLHIIAIDPIQSSSDVVWSLDVYDVLSIGSLAKDGRIFSTKIISCDGDGFNPSDKFLIKTTEGAHIKEFFPNHTNIIAGDPLSGKIKITNI